MKNLMVYVNPNKAFNKESEILIKIQIDNSLELGWKKEDIFLYTNFPYEYREVKAQLVSDDNFCPFRPLSTKTITVSNLKSFTDDIYWVHDLDAFQLNDMGKVDIDGYDMGCTDYGWSSKWCLGSYFITEWAHDILDKIRDTIYEIHNEDERALMKLTENKEIVTGRIKRLNITYNLGKRKIEFNYKQADKPLKVAHFHPYKMFTEFKPILNDRIINLFNKYGIR
jgi:hypothetical protein